MPDDIDDDELETMLERQPTAREATVAEHELRVKALDHPLRRRMIKAIGVFGKKRDELKKELGVSDTLLDFQKDFLVRGEFLEVEGDTFKLTDMGLALLSNI
ncbi:MAG: hypothetical protein SCH70_02485 [Candidatus Methanoperedens sp.]|nr:hypothetical protein [Candidatus Methanoperedens sp.]